jgi:hypothetical protein
MCGPFSRLVLMSVIAVLIMIGIIKKMRFDTQFLATRRRELRVETQRQRTLRLLVPALPWRRRARGHSHEVAPLQ